MSPGPNEQPPDQLSVSSGGSGCSGSETTLSVNWKGKKEGYLGISAWENSSIIHKDQGTVFGGYFFSKEIHKGCVVQRKEKLNEKVRETCQTRILLSCVTKFPSRAAIRTNNHLCQRETIPFVEQLSSVTPSPLTSCFKELISN